MDNAAKFASFLFLPSPPQRVIWNKRRNKTDADIVNIYSRLHCEYPLELRSSKEMGFKSNIDFPVLGKFEIFQGDLDFEFYSMKENGDFLAHFHFKSVTEAEKAVVDFMNGKLTIIQFGQPNNT